MKIEGCSWMASHGFPKRIGLTCLLCLFFIHFSLFLPTLISALGLEFDGMPADVEDPSPSLCDGEINDVSSETKQKDEATRIE